MPEEKDLTRYHTTAIIPAYKVEKEIAETLARIPDYIREIIVVDDASPDRTSEIVEEAQAKDARIKLIKHAENQGVGGAMLSGFKEVLKGKTAENKFKPKKPFKLDTLKGAAHGNCRACHQAEAKKDAKKKKLKKCTTCHPKKKKK